MGEGTGRGEMGDGDGRREGRGERGEYHMETGISLPKLVSISLTMYLPCVELSMPVQLVLYPHSPDIYMVSKWVCCINLVSSCNIMYVFPFSIFVIRFQ